jgi:hypothetical protein
MRKEADAFHDKYSEGILITVRLDHAANSTKPIITTPFKSTTYDDLMTDNVVRDGRGHGFVTVPYDTPYASALDKVKGEFLNRVPVGSEGMSITDQIPAGLTVDISSLGPDAMYDADARTITWNLSNDEDYAPGKRHTVSVVTTVDASRQTRDFNNAATVSISSYGDFPTNITYHRIKGDNRPFEHAKTASVGANPKDTGKKDSPILAEGAEEITYEITIDKPEMIVADKRYDVIFALDWSSSMGSKDPSSGVRSGLMNNSKEFARLYGKRLIMEMSDFVMENYPGSRISVMGHNAMSGNSSTNTPDYLHLQYDTPFVGSDEYKAIIKTSLGADPSQSDSDDDNAQALAAAIDKMAADTSVLYGNKYKDTKKQKRVIAREADAQNIPIIVLVSDFQYDTTDPYWEEALKVQAERFAQLYPEGILMTVRTDHSHNGSYKSTDHDAVMEKNVAPLQIEHWSFTSIGPSIALRDCFDTIKGRYVESAPIPDKRLIVTDKIPAGLNVDIDTISDEGSYDKDTHTITWDLTSHEFYTPGHKHTVSMATDVIKDEKGKAYDNRAAITYGAYSDMTNWTYHRQLAANVKAIHLRQVVVDPIAGLKLPYIGFFTITNDGRVYNITTDSNKSDVEVDFRMVGVLAKSDDKTYHIKDILPQGYDYAGYIVSSSYTQGSHDPAKRQTGPASIDLSNDKEVWVSVYIKPRPDSGKFSWSFATNLFGSIEIR